MPERRLVLERQRDEKGRFKTGQKDHWKATAEGLLPGIGPNRTEALGSFFSANIRAFGFISREDIDPESPNPVVIWMSGNPTG